MSKKRKKGKSSTRLPNNVSSMGRRVCWAIGLVVVTQGLVLAAETMLKPDVREPLMAVDELPSELGRWTAQAADLDARIFDALDAEQALNRTYSNVDGGEIGFHCAVWSSEDEWTPHPPTLCYAGSGWSRRDGRTVVLEGRPKARVRLQGFTRDGVRITSLYWYQVGDASYVSRNGARPVRQSLWGQKTRPPLVKVLMQSAHRPGVDSEDVEEELLELADLVFAWTSQL